MLKPLSNIGALLKSKILLILSTHFSTNSTLSKKFVNSIKHNTIVITGILPNFELGSVIELDV